MNDNTAATLIAIDDAATALEAAAHALRAAAVGVKGGVNPDSIGELIRAGQHLAITGKSRALGL